MGSYFSAQVNEAKQKATNDIYQTSDQDCVTNCSNIQSGNSIFLDGSVSGDILFVQECTAKASCMMNNAVDTVLTTLQDLKQQNETSASLFPNFGSVNLSLSDQEIENRVTQILNTTCSADIKNVQENTMIFARDSTTGNIVFKQGGNAQANCVMTNSASANLNLGQTGDQSNTIGGFGAGGLIALVIIIVIVLIIAGAAKGKSGGGGKK